MAGYKFKYKNQLISPTRVTQEKKLSLNTQIFFFLGW